jgi:hypothetical protein
MPMRIPRRPFDQTVGRLANLLMARRSMTFWRVIAVSEKIKQG